jgi:4-carboxymuconolactone decarboxylase
MARLPYPELQDAPPHIQTVLTELPPLRLFRMLAHAESAFEPSMQLGRAILAHLQLDPKLRELAILQLSRQADTRYEWVQHVDIGRGAGVSDDQVAAIERGDVGDTTRFTPLERAVLSFTAEVVAGPTVTDMTFAALYPALTAREIVELLLTIGNYLMVARVMTVLEIEIDSPAGSAVVHAAADDDGHV